MDNSSSPRNSARTMLALGDVYKGFISTESALEETRSRVKSLELSSRAHTWKYTRRRIAKTLHACISGTVCSSPACMSCVRAYQERVYESLSQQFLTYESLYHVTLVHERYWVPVGNLVDWHPHTIRNTIRQHFRRCDLPHVRAVGSIEVEYRPDQAKWVPHSHIVVSGASRPELNRLRKYYHGDTVSGSHRMVIQEVGQTDEDRARLFTYLFKSRTFVRDVLQCDSQDRRYRSRAYRPPASIHNEHLLFLFRHSFENLLLTIGIGARGCLFKNGSRVSPKRTSPPPIQLPELHQKPWSTYTPEYSEYEASRADKGDVSTIMKRFDDYLAD